MRRIGITQRVETDARRAERRDCLDHRWIHLLQSLDLHGVAIPNNLDQPRCWLEMMDWDGFILTGGNDIATLPHAAEPAPERDRTERELLDFALCRQLPVLGVCRGLQILNVQLGGSVSALPGHVACRHGVVPCSGASRFASFREVNSFHRMAIMPGDLAEELHATAHAPDRSVEAAAHRSLPWYGIMWHPERESPSVAADLALLRHCFGLTE
ncbi:MAG: gamma-glutamyl-gamma-aminobutyrate hydrolase family protein [Wenzhouxiangellaceae bacterium]|nr:gamma-glutamyl-gamma-aminobutyrate hydrolase family protein [Wenzhouxiangellaceae bacterium]